MEIAGHLEMLQLEGERMAAAAEDAGADAPVPSCGSWAVRDLLYHQGGVFRWAAAFVTQRKTERSEVDREAVTGPPPADDGLFDWFRQSHVTIVDALAAAPPDLQCWTFAAAPSPLAFWARRQAHEVSIHRVDAELAAEMTPEVVPAPFGADGLDELIIAFLSRQQGDARAEEARTLGVHCDDNDASWRIILTTEGVTTERDAGGTDCTVHGRASDLYHALWNRLPPAALHIAGDQGAIELFVADGRMRWKI